MAVTRGAQALRPTEPGLQAGWHHDGGSAVNRRALTIFAGSRLLQRDGAQEEKSAKLIRLCNSDDMTMPDALLATPDRQEALSRAYAGVIAASAGYTTHPPPDFDRDSIDLTFGAGGRMRPRIDAQLKATINLRRRGPHYTFKLSKKNYDDLRGPTMIPRIIIVLALPRKEVYWVNISVQRLIMRRSAFWASLRGKPELADGQQSITIQIPEANRFDIDGLKQLMEVARLGAIP
jgi:hypothetical protein